MKTRAFVLFWGATVASVLLLGSIWSVKDRVGDPGFGLGDVVLLTVAGLGFCVTFFVAARIAYVVGRVKKLRRTETSARV